MKRKRSPSKAEPKAQAYSMDAFKTRPSANDGLQVPLYLPDGTETADWLRIRGVDSDAFRESRDAEDRNVAEISQIKDPAEKSKAIAESVLRLTTSLVKAWSFDVPCTRENVAQFLRDAPHIASAIDRTAARRALFFVKP